DRRHAGKERAGHEPVDERQHGGMRRHPLEDGALGEQVVEPQRRVPFGERVQRLDVEGALEAPDLVAELDQERGLDGVLEDRPAVALDALDVSIDERVVHAPVVLQRRAGRQPVLPARPGAYRKRVALRERLMHGVSPAARDTVRAMLACGLQGGREVEMLRSAVIAVLVGSLVGVDADATMAPFDFTGHWTGTSQQKGQPANDLTADFTSSGPKTFTGTVTADNACTAKGTAKRHTRVVLRLDCGSGNTVKIHGRIDPATATIRGTFAEFRRRRPRHHGTFVLARQVTSMGGPATISFFSGATPAGHPAALDAGRPAASPVPRDGQWYLSPDKMILTVTSIQRRDSSGPSAGWRSRSGSSTI